MPQMEGYFIPQVWARPRPATFGQAIAAVLGLGGGDSSHLFKRQPEPGAGAWALLPTSAKMAYSLAGPGYIVQGNGASQIMSGPQVTWSRAQIATGQDGQVYGGGYQQGLIDYQAYIMGHEGQPPQNVRG